MSPLWLLLQTTAVGVQLSIVCIGSSAGKSVLRLGFTRYDRLVEVLGGHGEWVEKPEDIRPALQRAFGSGLPACVNVKTDPNVLPA